MRKQLRTGLFATLIFALIGTNNVLANAAPASKTTGAAKPAPPVKSAAVPKSAATANTGTKTGESKSATETSAATEKASTEKASTANANQKLHRADFRVSGASCVACLRRIGKTIRDLKGVAKADISIFKPYWAIVIYDADQTNMDKVFDSVKEEKIKFEEIEDKSIASLPTIIIPKVGNSGPAEKSGTPEKSGSAH